MVDRDLVVTKAGLIQKHLKRVEERRGSNLASFLDNPDRQDVICFNLQVAIQNCIDIGAHIVSEEALGVPGSVGEIFYTLEENGYISKEMTEKMIKAVGFRNIIVHEYGRIDLERVYDVAAHDMEDLQDFLTEIFLRLEISME